MVEWKLSDNTFKYRLPGRAPHAAHSWPASWEHASCPHKIDLEVAWNVQPTELPLSPPRLWQLIEQARNRGEGRQPKQS